MALFIINTACRSTASWGTRPSRYEKNEPSTPPTHSTNPIQPPSPSSAQASGFRPALRVIRELGTARSVLDRLGLEEPGPYLKRVVSCRCFVRVERRAMVLIYSVPYVCGLMTGAAVAVEGAGGPAGRAHAATGLYLLPNTRQPNTDQSSHNSTQ